MPGRKSPDDRDAFGQFLPPAAPPSSVPPPFGATPEPVAPSAPVGTQPPTWKPWLGFVAVILAFAAATVMSLILVLATTGLDQDKLDSGDLPPGVMIGSLVLQDFAFLAAAIGLAAALAAPHPWHFGWRPVRSFWSSVGWSALLYFSFLLFTAGWLALTGSTEEKDTIAQDLGAGSSVAISITIAVLVSIGAPIVEELLFRGVMFGALRQKMNLLPAALITGAMFGSAHVLGSPIAFILPLAFLGAGLCLLYHKTGSLYPSMAVHAVNNSVAIVGALEWDLWLIPVVLVGSLSVIALTAVIVRVRTAPIPADAPSP